MNKPLVDKIKEIEEKLAKLRQAPQEPEARRKVIKETVGDAEVFLTELLVFLRSLN